MTATVEQMQRDLAGIIRVATSGEDVLITDRGEPVAKLVGVGRTVAAPKRAEWLRSLRELREHTATGKPGTSTDQLITEDRAERV